MRDLRSKANKCMCTVHDIHKSTHNTQSSQVNDRGQVAEAPMHLASAMSAIACPLMVTHDSPQGSQSWANVKQKTYYTNIIHHVNDNQAFIIVQVHFNATEHTQAIKPVKEQDWGSSELAPVILLRGILPTSCHLSSTARPAGPSGAGGCICGWGSHGATVLLGATGEMWRPWCHAVTGDIGRPWCHAATCIATCHAVTWLWHAGTWWCLTQSWQWWTLRLWPRHGGVGWWLFPGTHQGGGPGGGGGGLDGLALFNGRAWNASTTPDLGQNWCLHIGIDNWHVFWIECFWKCLCQSWHSTKCSPVTWHHVPQCHRQSPMPASHLAWSDWRRRRHLASWSTVPRPSDGIKWHESNSIKWHTHGSSTMTQWHMTAAQWWSQESDPPRSRRT